MGRSQITPLVNSKTSLRRATPAGTSQGSLDHQRRSRSIQVLCRGTGFDHQIDEDLARRDLSARQTRESRKAHGGEASDACQRRAWHVPAATRSSIGGAANGARETRPKCPVPFWQSEVCQEESVRTIHSADGEEAQCGGVLKDGQELENME